MTKLSIRAKAFKEDSQELAQLLNIAVDSIKDFNNSQLVSVDELLSPCSTSSAASSILPKISFSAFDITNANQIASSAPTNCRQTENSNKLVIYIVTYISY
jgi:hypothetical protein